MQNEGFSIKVDLADIDPLSGLDFAISRPFADFFESDEKVKAVGDMEAKLQITASHDEYFVSGLVTGRMNVKCGRCLKEYEELLQAEIYAPFVSKDAWHEAETGKRAREEHDPTHEGGEGSGMGADDDSDVYYYEETGLELYTLIRDQLLLSMPLKQVCSEECKGLCQKCGIDLNVKSCDCPEKDADSRFAVLEQLKNKLEK